MFALVDCNSFFCSVEKAFHPGLDGKPVCVLSSNDGCIVALTPEAKALGLHRGDPIFQVRQVVDAHGVTLFSTNMYLYAAMSQRVTNILRQSVQKVENYSIDESFCCLDGYERYYNLEDYMRGVAQKIKLWTDIPVSIGVAPTKTLAKMGSKFAKQYAGYQSVCMIDTEAKRLKALELFPLEDVWGVGRQTLKQLHYLGVHTPLALALKTEGWVRSHFKLPVLNTWRELNGMPCIDTSEVVRNQSICTSRSFGQMVTDLDSLRASVATFAGSCANKLRGQHAIAAQVTVFLSSNRFRDDLPQYQNAQTTLLPIATADTLEITQAALQLLKSMYLPGIHYKKTGVILSHITPESHQQTWLFDAVPNRTERIKLMHTIDHLNQRYGLKSVRLAVEGGEAAPWHVKCEHRSGNYLTDVNDLLTIHI